MQLHPAVGSAEEEFSAAPWAEVAAIAYGTAAVLALLLAFAYADHLHALYSWLRQSFDAGRSGQSTPPAPVLPASYSLLSLPLELVTIGSEIVLLVWQFRSARTARLLGFPARHRPGWGVGFWFIPIANLFCPYQALVDCLPRDHPERSLVLRFWLTLVAADVITLVASFAMPFNRSTGVIISLVAIGLWLLYMGLLRQMISVVGAAHRSAAGMAARTG
jgi:hypothetical protein